jgi:hypothetical protein
MRENVSSMSEKDYEIMGLSKVKVKRVILLKCKGLALLKYECSMWFGIMRKEGNAD